jgi:hypothetical protein
MILRREVGAAVERLAIGGEESSERPSALSADGLHGGLVSAIDIGTLVAVDFHGDEMLIDDRGNFGIVVGLAIHHMTPVAPNRADVEQHWLVLAPSSGEGLRAPLVPVNGLMHGRAQVGGRGAGEGVERRGGHSPSLSRVEALGPLGLMNARLQDDATKRGTGSITYMKGACAFLWTSRLAVAASLKHKVVCGLDVGKDMGS